MLRLCLCLYGNCMFQYVRSTMERQPLATGCVAMATERRGTFQGHSPFCGRASDLSPLVLEWIDGYKENKGEHGERDKKNTEKRSEHSYVYLKSFVLLSSQISMHGPGTSRRRSAPCVRASRSSTAAATTRTRTATSCPWTTACRACWASAWTCPRTSTTATRCGWRGRCSRSRSSGRGCCRILDGDERARGVGWEAVESKVTHTQACQFGCAENAAQGEEEWGGEYESGGEELEKSPLGPGWEEMEE